MPRLRSDPMARFKIPNLTTRPRRDGSCRYIWQPHIPPGSAMRMAGWRSCRLSDDMVEAIAEARAWNDRVQAWREGKLASPNGSDTPAMAGTVNALIDHYLADADYRDKRPKTKRSYDQNIAIIQKWCGNHDVGAVDRVDVQDFYKKLAKKTPARARAVVVMLGILFSHGQRTIKGFPALNPALVQKLKGSRPSGRIWSALEVRYFVRVADGLGLHSIATAVRLNEWMGQRQGDILAMTWAIYRRGEILINQSKTGAVVAPPVDMVVALKSRLEAERRRQASPHKTITATTIIVCEATGRAWEEDHFRHEFARVRGVAAKRLPSIADCQFMHLRHTAVTRLAESNVDHPGIAAITGHSNASVATILERYIVRTRKMARQAFQKRLDSEGKSQKG